MIANCGLLHAEALTNGVEFLNYTTVHPNQVHVLKMDRSNPDLMIHMGFPQKTRNFTSRQNVQTIAATYDLPPDFDVIGAVNGSFFDYTGIQIYDAVGSENEVIQGPGGSRETFFLTDARVPRIIRSLRTVSQELRFPDGTTMPIDHWNDTRNADTLAMYTPHWGSGTRTSFSGVEIVLSGVNHPARADKWVSGVVTAIHTGEASKNNPIAADQIVLSARDAKATQLLNKVSIGDRLEVRMDINHSNGSNSALMITGRGWLLDKGDINNANWVNHSTSTVREPRTAVAWNATHIFLVAIDGRQAGVSVGMNFQEMAEFLKDTVGATDALNLDGGGSTTMIADGILRNTPSGGVQRAVTNSLMIVKKLSSFVPASDSFPVSGRQLLWDEMYKYNPVVPFAPQPAGGDGYVMHLESNETTGYETASVGNVSDTNYAVEADIYLDHLPGEFPGDETGGIFARDNGSGMWDFKSYDGGHCYAMAYATDLGRLSMGKIVSGNIQTFATQTITEDGWHNFRIECEGDEIRYYLDGELAATATDSSRPSGRAGIAVSSNFTDPALAKGFYIENFKHEALPASVGSWELY